jgi:hypothetical protein
MNLQMSALQAKGARGSDHFFARCIPPFPALPLEYDLERMGLIFLFAFGTSLGSELHLIGVGRNCCRRDFAMSLCPNKRIVKGLTIELRSLCLLGRFRYAGGLGSLRTLHNHRLHRVALVHGLQLCGDNGFDNLNFALAGHPPIPHYRTQSKTIGAMALKSSPSSSNSSFGTPLGTLPERLEAKLILIGSETCRDAWLSVILTLGTPRCQ